MILQATSTASFPQKYYLRKLLFVRGWSRRRFASVQSVDSSGVMMVVGFGLL